jgi:hypothetical protein
MAQAYELAGPGIWALGFDGGDPQMLNALLGFAPATKDTGVGPSSTSPSVSSPTTSTTTGPPTSTSTSVPPASTTTAVPRPGGTATTTTSEPPTTTTPTTADGGETLHYSGIWQARTVVLSLVQTGQPLPAGTPAHVGDLREFQTNDPGFSCLAAASALGVWHFSGDDYEDVVLAQQPGDCTTAEFTFAAIGSSAMDSIEIASVSLRVIRGSTADTCRRQ